MRPRAGGTRKCTSEASLMTASGAPAEIGSPSLMGSSAITPALWAVISFSIFIASMMVTS